MPPHLKREMTKCELVKPLHNSDEVLLIRCKALTAQNTDRGGPSTLRSLLQQQIDLIPLIPI